MPPVTATGPPLMSLPSMPMMLSLSPSTSVSLASTSILMGVSSGVRAKSFDSAGVSSSGVTTMSTRETAMPPLPSSTVTVKLSLPL